MRQTKLWRAWEELTERSDKLRTIDKGPSKRSLIAGANALFRAVESKRPPGQRIVYDPLAQNLTDDHFLILLVRIARFLIPPLYLEVERLKTAHCTRHRAMDERVKQALDDGFTQIVIVGAGYDTRASRFAPRARGVCWFEIDTPHTAAYKCAKLQGLPGVNEDVQRGTGDLVTDGLRALLQQTNFVRDKPTCFVLEGLIHYLPPACLEEIIHTASDGEARRRVVLSFIDPEMVKASSPVFAGLVKALREVPRQYFPPHVLEQRFAAYGFSSAGHWPFAKQVQDFAPEAASRSVGVSQDVAQFDSEPR